MEAFDGLIKGPSGPFLMDRSWSNKLLLTVLLIAPNATNHLMPLA